jgi:hypothetical protein
MGCVQELADSEAGGCPPFGKSAVDGLPAQRTRLAHNRLLGIDNYVFVCENSVVADGRQ